MNTTLMGRFVPTICYFSFFYKETEIDFNRTISYLGGGGAVII